MNKIYIFTVLIIVLFTSCTKRDYVPVEVDPYQWMRTHDEGIVSYVDYYTGNYIIETYEGYTVVESWGSYTPREYDREYAYFNSRGVQTIYNRSGDYFTKGRIVESWLSLSDAFYVLDQLAAYGR
ncbi:MAG: hypothetical protein JNK79_20070 [Chitinophagaceae bacterium]|nr:hypothetical protein [Chitinophagaceae bacterium]